MLGVYTVPSVPLSDPSCAAGPHILRLSRCRWNLFQPHACPKLSRDITIMQQADPLKRAANRSVSPRAVLDAEEPLVPPRQRARPSALLFLAGSLVIKYEAPQENGRLLLDVSMPVLDVVKCWAPVSGHTSQGLNANYSQRRKVLLRSVLQVALRKRNINFIMKI